MKNRENKPVPWRPIHRFFLAALGFLLIGRGLLGIFAGRIHDWNDWGGFAFIPFVILIGILLLLGALTLRSDRK